MKILFLLLFLLLFPLNTSAQEYPFQVGHTHDILEVKFSPDDTQLISYSAGDGRFCLWEVKSGRLLWVTKTEFIQRGDEYYNLKEFYWSENGNFIITKSMNGTYQTWNAKTGKILTISEAQPGIKLISPNKKSLSITKDYDKISIANGVTKEIRRFGNNSAFDTSNDGTMIAEGGGWGDASIRITEVTTGKSWWLDGHPSVIKTIAYSPDGKYLAVAGSDKNIYIFDVSKHALSKTLAGHTEPVSFIAFNPDGKTLLSSSKDESLKVWDWQKGNLLQDIKFGRGIWDTKKIEFTKDGKYFLTVDEGTLQIWNAQTFKSMREIKTAEGYESKGGNMTIGYSSVPILTAMFTDSSKRVLSSHEDGTFRTWDYMTGKQLGIIKIGNEAPFVSISRDSKTILAAVSKGDEYQIRLFDANNGREIRRFDDEETSYIEVLSLSPNGKNFATSDVSGDVFLWDINRTKPIRELEIGFSGDDAIAFSPDGKVVAIGGRNQNLFLFDVDTGNKLWQLIPSYQPSELEIRLTKEQEQRQAKLNEAKAQRDKQAEIDAKVFKKQVYITFEHYGDMTDPGEQRIVESDEPNKSKVKKSAEESNAIWLRLHNDSPLPIKIPTQSMYLPNPKCFYEFPNGQKILGLCADREISVWFGLEDKEGKQVPYGFDFGSSAILLPKTSVLFAVPRGVLRNGNAIRFGFTFQKEAADNKVEDYGKNILLRFKESDLPKSSKGK